MNLRTAKQIFIEAGFHPEMIGETSIKAFAEKWRKKYRDYDILALKDTRRSHSGRSRKTDSTSEQQIEKMQAEVSLLEQKNELLKNQNRTKRG